MPRTLISGGAGFLGSYLCERLLQEDHDVICVDNFLTGHERNLAPLHENRRFRFIRHDVTEDLHVAGNLDFVLHFASPASPADYAKFGIKTLKINAIGAHKMLGIAKAKSATFLLASTSEVYGDPEVNPQPETYWGHVNPVGPRSVYDEGKRFAEALAMAYHHEHGMAVKIARIFNTYGPRMRNDDGRAIPNFLGAILRGQPITIFGDVNPEERSVNELAELAQAVTGRRVGVVHRPLPEDDPHVRCPDITLARRVLGWEPKVPLEEGLRRSYLYFQSLVAEAAA